MFQFGAGSKLGRFVVMLSLLSATGCSAPPLYMPNPPQMPMLKEQGEGEVALEFDGDGVGASGAYALTDHVGLIAAISNRPKEGADSSYSADIFGEIGAGYYATFSDFGRLEIYGGVGFGHPTFRETYPVNIFCGYCSVHSIDSPDTVPNSSLGPIDTLRAVSANYIRPFLQLTIGGEGTGFGMGFGLRAELVEMFRYQEQNLLLQYTYDSSGHATAVPRGSFSVNRKFADVFLTPSLLMRFGSDPWRVGFEYWNTNSIGKLPYYDYRGSNFALTFNFFFLRNHPAE